MEYNNLQDNIRKNEYNNPNELLELIEASRTLKGVHPDLYEKYQFQTNLERLCEIQPENNLQSKIQEAMNNLEQKTEKSKETKIEEIEK